MSKVIPVFLKHLKVMTPEAAILLSYIANRIWDEEREMEMEACGKLRKPLTKEQYALTREMQKGWFLFPLREITEELNMKKDIQSTRVKELETLGYIETRRKEVGNLRWIRLVD